MKGKPKIYIITKKGLKEKTNNPIYFKEEQEILNLLKESPRTINELKNKLLDKGLKREWWTIREFMNNLEGKKLITLRK